MIVMDLEPGSLAMDIDLLVYLYKTKELLKSICFVTTSKWVYLQENHFIIILLLSNSYLLLLIIKVYYFQFNISETIDMSLLFMCD